MIATLTLDTESSRLVVEYLAYVTAQPITVHGLVSDAALTGLLSVWADPELTVRTGDAICAEAARDVVCDGAELPLVVADPDLRARAVLRAEELANASGQPLDRVYLAAVRVGLRKFAAQIRAQKGTGQ